MTTPTPSYTPEQLRGWADNEQRASLAAVLRAHAVALEDLAAAQEAEIERLKAHAEAMVNHLDEGIVSDTEPESGATYPRSDWDFIANELVVAYRRDFPKEGT